jgi:hypothetical protein
VKIVKDKYKNYEKEFYISHNSHESTLDVTRYITEVWSFDGQHFKKTTDDTSAKSKIPEAKFGIDEFLAYVDELSRFRDLLIVEKPKQLPPTST